MTGKKYLSPTPTKRDWMQLAHTLLRNVPWIGRISDSFRAIPDTRFSCQLFDTGAPLAELLLQNYKLWYLPNFVALLLGELVSIGTTIWCPVLSQLSDIPPIHGKDQRPINLTVETVSLAQNWPVIRNKRENNE